MKTPDNFDFEEVSVEDAAKVRSPAEHAKKMEEVGKSNMVSQEPKNLNIQDISKIKELNQKIAETMSVHKSPPEAKIIKNLGSSNEKVLKELNRDYPNIAEAHNPQEFIRSQNAVYFSDAEKVGAIGSAIGLGIIAPNALALPGFIAALAAGPTGVVSTLGIGVATTFGVVPVVVALGLVGYGGYKLLKKFRGMRKTKEDIAKFQSLD